MAAPIVTGTIALMKSLKKDFTVEQARIALFNSGADVYGNIPPMVLVDKALLAVKNGDYKELKKRSSRPVPEADIPSLNSGGGTIVVLPGEEEVVVPVDKTPDVVATPTDGTDYDEIRRLIREYEKKIEELKKKLPK